MHRCLQLAKLGDGHTAPNPMVGCVIVHNGKIIGEGFHQKCGGPHAEVNAINSVKDKVLLTESTLYVNLEPCSHFGKTPPCSDLIIQKKIPRVVIGTPDPFAKVSGNGIKKLKAAGCDITVGILANECQQLNRRFFTFHTKQRPYIILKWAQTADGFIDVIPEKRKSGHPNWITNEMARVAVHKQRSTEGAILIGTETAMKDNPSLTLRDWHGKQPARIILDLKNRLPAGLHVFDNRAETFVLASNHYPDKRNANIIKTTAENLHNDLLEFLYRNGIQSVIVEGGAKTLQGFIDKGLWDEAFVYTGDIFFGNGVKAPKLDGQDIAVEIFGNSILKVFRNRTIK
ncbi:MAG: bifunctional diaminohydroxyphosphoribosylaminopyrimidine deaminase/5-amino-6-(5-phosphoribosylamino)uracil reductase RibD [Prolixibacteraceae bacterium]|nr:bifunctional diaminohydroxyphosphoribosylaminopyrimidine deaminase/5-amino-6-(5-phosphoribosylamino)uracil reductase RibD [Prolixibacteraceae bacterium]